MTLDSRGWTLHRDRLDDVGIKSTLYQIMDAAEVPRFLFEDADELLPNDLALLLRVGDAGEPIEEPRRPIHRPNIEAHLVPEHRGDLLKLVLAQQAIVDEDAGEAIADGATDQGRRYRGVHSSRKRAQGTPVSDSSSNRLHCLLDEGAREPVRADPAKFDDKAPQDVFALLRVPHLRVELHGIHLRLRVLNHRDSVLGFPGDAKARRDRHHMIAVAVPDSQR